MKFNSFKIQKRKFVKTITFMFKLINSLNWVFWGKVVLRVFSTMFRHFRSDWSDSENPNSDPNFCFFASVSDLLLNTFSHPLKAFSWPEVKSMLKSLWNDVESAVSYVLNTVSLLLTFLILEQSRFYTQTNNNFSGMS